MVGVIFLTQTRFSRSKRLRAHFKTMMISVFLWFLGGWVGGFFFFFFPVRNVFGPQRGMVSLHKTPLLDGLDAPGRSSSARRKRTVPALSQ